MSNSLSRSSQAYRALIHRLRKASPGYQGLDEFVNIKKDTCQSASKFSILTISANEQQETTESRIGHQDFEGTTKLAEYLPHLQDENESCNIFLVENVCPETIVLFGGFFDINPQFFADHVKNGDWFKDSNLMDLLPALPSSQKWHDFLQVRFVQSLELFKKPPSGFDSASEWGSQTGAEVKQDPTVDYLVPDENITRLPRKAGRLTLLAPDREGPDSLLCTKQNIAVWFGKRGSQIKGWNGR